MSYVLIKYLHIIAIMIMMACLCLEHYLLKPQLSATEMRKLAVIDGIYGLASAAILGAGLTLWFGVGKGQAFYSANHLFHLKVGLFILLGLLSIYPTIFFLKHRKTEADTTIAPRVIILLVRIELLLTLLIPLLAVLMAQGIGLPHSAQ